MTAIDTAIEQSARALAAYEGNERVFQGEDNSEVAHRGAEAYRETARVAVGSFVAAVRLQAAERAA